MTPSMPPVDRRGNGRELSEDEVQAKIGEAHEKAKRAKNQTKGGILIGTVGVVVAANGAIFQDNIWMALIGFIMALIGFGFTSPKEAASMVRGLLGRGDKD